jgi:sodium/hydrogen antiporter
MSEPTAFALASLIIGVLMLFKTLAGSFLSKLPLSMAMIYLGVGLAIGPNGLNLMEFDLLDDAKLLEHITEIAVLISLFTGGMKLELPLTDKRWRIPVQLASVSMVITVGLITLIGIWGLGLSPGAAVLLGAILAPTDPVLASDVQVSDPGDRDRLRFGLTGEGGLNDGTAFPFVMLGLGLLGVHELGENAWRWWTVDVLWAVAAGLAVGYLLGALVGRVVIYLRVHHRQAQSSEEFIALGLIALAYGVSILITAYGFLAVFAAGLAMRRLDTHDTQNMGKQKPADEAAEAPPAKLMSEIERFNSQLESFAEVGIVLVVGVLLATVEFRWDVLWFVPLLFLVVRPLAVYVGLIGTGVKGTQRRLMAWFGIRGIGSLYYLLYATNHDIDLALAEDLLSITIAVIVASVVAHGVSVTPLMQRYEARKAAAIKKREKLRTG